MGIGRLHFLGRLRMMGMEYGWENSSGSNEAMLWTLDVK